MGGTTLIDKRARPSGVGSFSTGGIIQMSGCTLLCVSLIFSLCFILAVSCAFWGDNEDEPYFKSILNEIALTNPGVCTMPFSPSAPGGSGSSTNGLDRALGRKCRRRCR